MKIPKGSIGFVSGKSFVSQGIKWYSRLFEKIDKKYACNHALLVHDNGIIYESNPKGNEPGHISKYENSKYKVWIYYNKDLKEKNYKMGLAYSTGALGRIYDYGGFFGFLFKFFKQSKYRDFCSEYVTKTVRKYYKLFLCPGYKPSKVTPARQFRYCDDKTLDHGWELFAYFDGKKWNKKWL